MVAVGKNRAKAGAPVEGGGAGGVRRRPGVVGGELVLGGNVEVVGEVGLEDRGELWVVDDDVPVPVVVAGRVGVGGCGDRVDVGLVGVVPVPAGQPQPLVVLDGDLDVVG